MKVSVLTPTRNRPQFIARAVASVMAQTHTDWELVVHDVSDTPIRQLLPDDPRITYSAGVARGPALDFQSCLGRATGEIIHPLADDDTLPAHALATAVRAIQDRDWLVARTVLRDLEGNVLCHRGGDAESVRSTRDGSYMLGGAIYWRKDLTDRLGGFSAAYDGAADFDLYARFIRHTWPAIIPDVLYQYTDWAGTDSRVRAGNQRAVSDMIADRLRNEDA